MTQHWNVLDEVKKLTNSILRWSAGPETLQRNKADVVATLHILYTELGELAGLLTSQDAAALKACTRKLRRHGGEIILQASGGYSTTIEEIRAWAIFWDDFEESVSQLKTFLDRLLDNTVNASLPAKPTVRATMV